MYYVRYPLSFRQVEDICMNGVSIFAMKQFGFGLGVLDQSSREKSVRSGQATTQIGNGI